VRWLATVLICGMACAPLWAQAACADFAWDVHHERALCAGEAQSLPAGTDRASAPTIRADRYYDLQLSPQPGVKFVAAPGKVMLADGAYAGLIKLTVAKAGSYRVSLDRPYWIDVVSDGKLLPTQDFQGSRGCSAPHKIVEFVLPANQQLWLQFIGATAAQLHLTVTSSPAAKAPRS
jgi:hypothetical protein